MRSRTDSASRRIIPHLNRIQEAVDKLPEADSVKDDTHSVELGNGLSIDFRRIKLKDSSGKGYRWIYEGKLLVD